MKYTGTYKQNIDKPILNYLLEQRGIPENKITHYLNTTDEDICDYAGLGLPLLKAAAASFFDAVDNDKTMFILVDCDADGYLSSALLLNWIYDYKPSYIDKIKYWLHDGKQHGLNDCINLILEKHYDIVVVPDASTNDVYECDLLKQNNIPCIVLDHHLKEFENNSAIIINNQCSEYDNKELCGAGVVWQFLRYIEHEYKPELDFVTKYEDIVAVANCSDMMSLTSIETKHIMNKGFQKLTNPFLYGLAQKNALFIGDELTPIGCAFYITPLINAIVRSGTIEEKTLIFESMLSFKAFEEILSNKRGHKPGETEYRYEQALRCATNVKRRQTKAQDAGMELIEKLIEQNHMLEHKALIFYLPNDLGIEPTLRGLIANKIMAKYQRPCAILTLSSKGYAGSARGYTKSGIMNFKDICEKSPYSVYAIGHQNAFGLCILENYKTQFLEYLDKILADVGTEPIYNCDVIYNDENIEGDDFIAIADMKSLWGQDMDEPYICLENITINEKNVNVYKKKDITIKITLPNNISLLKFKATEEDYECLCGDGWKTLTIIGKASKNEWMGRITPQLIINDYEVKQGKQWIF